MVGEELYSEFFYTIHWIYLFFYLVLFDPGTVLGSEDSKLR